MLDLLFDSLNHARVTSRMVTGSDWLVRLASSAGLVTRIRSAAQDVAARARDKAAKVFPFALATTMAVAGLQTPALWAAAPAGALITNTASASYGVGATTATAVGSVAVTTALQTPATIEFLRFAPGVGTGAAPVTVSATQCKAANLALPTVPGTGVLPLPSQQPLATATSYARGDPVMVRLTDYDQNKNPLVAETVVVDVSTDSGDLETLTFTETGLSTGVFVGYIQSAGVPVVKDNCLLNITGNTRISASYKDGPGGATIISTAALVDPLGLLFDTSTGLPVNGAQITVINVATGLPAQVFGNDGVSAFPSTVISGSTVTDAGGEVYALAPGRYQFPRMAVGNYRFQITPPAGYTAPSLVADAQIQALPGGPFILVLGSRGQNFPLTNGPALEIDIPLDAGAGANVQITKSAFKATTAVGEFVPYLLSIVNGGTNPIAALSIADRLPQGFRYQAGSARLGGVAVADPVVSADGRGLTFRLGAMAGGATFSLRYVAAVSAGAVVGPAENTAQAVGGVRSNVARASVLVREDLNRSTAILVGEVTVDGHCNRHPDETAQWLARQPGQSQTNTVGSGRVGLKGVRVLLQDGTYVITDDEGRWHADNIRPGTHVVQIDETTLPKDYELEACDQNTRTGGRNFSQFVNVRGGTLWRADFRLKRVASCLRQQIQIQGKSVRVQVGAGVANQSVSASLMLPSGIKLLAGSLKVDGQAAADSQVTSGDGFLVARLGAHTGSWSHALEFELEQAPVSPNDSLGLRVQVQPLNQAVQGLPPLVLKALATEADICAPLTSPVYASAIAPTSARSAQSVATVPAGPAVVAAKPANTLQLVEILPYDEKWIAQAAPGAEWLHPRTGFAPALPVVKLAIKHDAKHLVDVKVNGQTVNAMRYEGQILNLAGTLALSNWRSVDLREGANPIEVTVRDAQGQVVLNESRTIHFAAGASAVVFDAKRSRLQADGRTSPIIAVRMLDKQGNPARRGSSGEFQVSAPYLAQSQADAIQREPLTGNLDAKARFEVGEDGVALIALQPTTQSGEVVLKFDLGNNGRVQEVRTWLAPDMREWVLVGFAEGTVGFKDLSGNMENIAGAGGDDRLFDQNRLAFYGKGQIKGEYLMTIAYDSAKRANNSTDKVFKQAIDPNQYYTLYADATQAQFDAASVSKLYLKIEKQQFYAMFGDFDTGLSVTELGRYSRTLNGVKSEYKGEQFSYSVFASETAQSFRRDEIQGDGTSGLYRLTARDIVPNSDKVTVEVRDRFRPEIIVSTRALTRYLDYQIDHALGTLFFTQPIVSRDANFNPTMIVVEYESESPLGAKLTYGGRVGMKLGEKTELGLTHINEGVVGREASLTSADVSVQLSEKTKLRAETAQSQRLTATGPQSGNASLIEITHNDGKTAARAYARQQDPGFGLGQQAASEAGTRKVGADVQVKLSDQLQLKAEAYTQQDLVSGGKRDVAEALGQWSKDGVSASAGLRMGNETNPAGASSTVRQLLAGVGYELMDKRLALRANAELDIGGQNDGPSGSQTFPNRLILGADYRLTEQTTFFAEHEVARSAALQANTTRIGLRTQPWLGAELSSSLGSQAGTDSNRLYGNLGLVQKLKINDKWSADFGVDRSQTLASTAPNAFNAAQPLPSGTLPAGTPGLVSGDFTAIYVGAAYQAVEWSANGRLELRTSDTDRKVNLLLGAQRKLDAGRIAAAGLTYTRTEGALNSSLLNARVSYASRPLQGKLMWLDRLEYQADTNQDATGNLRTAKLINNFNANWLPDSRTQIALQHGLKFVFDTIDGAAYQGFTSLMGIEARRDIGNAMDIGLHLGSLQSHATGTRDYQVGVSVGFKVADNAWLSVGYNQRGFMDADFSGAAYRAQGVYLNLRFKFDQNTFNLNDRKSTLPLKN